MGRNTYFPKGYLLAAFVTKALYYIPDNDVRPLPDPIPLIQGVTGSIIDVNQSPNGDIFFRDRQRHLSAHSAAARRL
jgi:hypothetical protein